MPLPARQAKRTVRRYVGVFAELHRRDPLVSQHTAEAEPSHGAVARPRVTDVKPEVPAHLDAAM